MSQSEPVLFVQCIIMVIDLFHLGVSWLHIDELNKSNTVLGIVDVGYHASYHCR